MTNTKGKIIVTGATGFVGNALFNHLLTDTTCTPVAITRQRHTAAFPTGSTVIQAGNITPDTNWSTALQGAEYVVHTAARVHVMRDTSSDPLEAFRKVNVQGTLNLAQQAVHHQIKRFIFISSIKVNGEGTAPGHAYRADDTPAPADPYGISKLEAEQQLLKLATTSGMEVVIIRPPLVYGPGVKANFLKMMQWVYRGIPLPFGAIHNKRSLVALDNLVDLIKCCISHPAAANQTFLAGDGQDLSTTELLRKIGMFMEKRLRLLPIPENLLKSTAALLGKADIGHRLCGSLQVDISPTSEQLGWTPPLSTDEGLQKTVADFLSKQNQ